MICCDCRVSKGRFALHAALEVPAQGLTGLFGPSGCGKTTLLRCIAGLERFSGFARFGGEAWQDAPHDVRVPAHERGIGFVFQHAALFPHLDVEENIAYGQARRGGRDGMARSEVVELTGISHLLERSPKTLSGGERQRVALARAILSQPRLLLLDEPLASLDLDSRAMILPLLQRLRSELKIPMIYVSHSAEEVGKLADRVMMMQAGAIGRVITVEEFRQIKSL
ncbi:ATP-binding cassette domain-containing protein [Candidatus Sumerlaeota bacterium]|nr:ATP-binding cassette domain-containing protein [Candidatus Sumerlaeota bacterium]